MYTAALGHDFPWSVSLDELLPSDVDVDWLPTLLFLVRCQGDNDSFLLLVTGSGVPLLPEGQRYGLALRFHRKSVEL